jgi:hypothetical protein
VGLSLGYAAAHPWHELRIVNDPRLLGVRVVRVEAGDPKIAAVYRRGSAADATDMGCAQLIEARRGEWC